MAGSGPVSKLEKPVVVSLHAVVVEGSPVSLKEASQPAQHLIVLGTMMRLASQCCPESMAGIRVPRGRWTFVACFVLHLLSPSVPSASQTWCRVHAARGEMCGGGHMDRAYGQGDCRDDR